MNPANRSDDLYSVKKPDLGPMVTINDDKWVRTIYTVRAIAPVSHVFAARPFELTFDHLTTTYTTLKVGNETVMSNTACFDPEDESDDPTVTTGLLRLVHYVPLTNPDFFKVPYKVTIRIAKLSNDEISIWADEPTGFEYRPLWSAIDLFEDDDCLMMERLDLAANLAVRSINDAEYLPSDPAKLDDLIKKRMKAYKDLLAEALGSTSFVKLVPHRSRSETDDPVKQYSDVLMAMQQHVEID